jgi:hypothetical protein
MRWLCIVVFSIIALRLVTPTHATGTVTNCTEAELDAALANGGDVLIACNGTIAFTSTKVIAADTTLDATGYSCALSGSNRVRLFIVNTGAVLTLRHLTLAFGTVTNISTWFADGGAAVLNRGTLRLERCLFFSNRVYGAPGTLESGAQGGAIHNKAGIVVANECTFLTNTCTGGLGQNASIEGYAGGPARGGAIFSEMGFCRITNSCFAHNEVVGGNGGRGIGEDSSGGYGGSALGGALYLQGSGGSGVVALVNCTLATNRCRGGNGGVPFIQPGQIGSGGDGEGGGIANVGGTVVCVNATLAANRATAGTGSPSGLPGGDNLDNSVGTIALTNTIIAYGVRTNATGMTVIDGGNNVSSDGSCRFTRSFNSIDPRLLSLRDNGGPTLTMLAQPDSIAINNANAGAAPSRDQRGFARHLLPDIGAVEFQAPRIMNWSSSGGHFLFEVMAENGVAHSVEFAPSVPYTNWFSLAVFNPTNRAFSVDDNSAGTASNHFYRVNTQ